MQPVALSRYALRALFGPPLILTLIVSILAMIASAAGWFGLALNGILVTWVWAYTYILIDYTAHGRPVPVLSIEMTNPWHEPRPLIQALLIALVASFAYWLWLHDARGAAVSIALVALALVPASLAVLAVDGSIARAVWPPALLAVARGVGWRYPMLVGAACLGAFAIATLASHVPSLVVYVAAQIACYAFASALGGALYERRLELGLEAWESPERRDAKRAVESDRQRDRAADEIYQLVRIGRHADALRLLGAALGPAPVDPEAIRWFRDRAARWEHRGLAERLTGELVARLLALGRRGEALLEVESWWRQGGEFKPCAARDLDVLKSVAAELGHAAARDRLSRQSPPASQANG